MDQAAAGIAAFIGARAALEAPWSVTVSLSGSSPRIVAWPVAAPSPPEPIARPLTSPSVHGEYRLPSDAHDGYQVSAPVYSACRPVNSIPLSEAEGLNGQSAGGSERHWPAELVFAAAVILDPGVGSALDGE